MGGIFLLCAITFLGMGGLTCYLGIMDGRRDVAMFASIFIAVGFWLLSQAIKMFKQGKQDRKVIEEGRSILATIVGYMDGSVIVNNKYSVAVVLEYIPVGKLEPVQEVYETNGFSITPYPIGSSVVVKYLDGRYAWDRKPVLSEEEIEEKRGPKFL